MVNPLTIDSSVFIASVLENEPFHKESHHLLKKVSQGEFKTVEPYTVLVEVVAAIKRRTKDEELAQTIKKDLLTERNLLFYELTEQRAKKAADLATQTGLRGMDAVVVQVAKENEASLVSLDEELVEKAKAIVEIKEVESLV